MARGARATEATELLFATLLMIEAVAPVLDAAPLEDDALFVDETREEERVEPVLVDEALEEDGRVVDETCEDESEEMLEPVFVDVPLEDGTLLANEAGATP